MVLCRIWPSMWICHFKRFWILRSASMIGQCRTSTIKIQPPKSIRNGRSWESNRHLQSIEKTLYRLSFCRCSCSQRPFHCPQSPQHLGHPWLFWLREEILLFFAWSSTAGYCTWFSQVIVSVEQISGYHQWANVGSFQGRYFNGGKRMKYTMKQKTKKWQNYKWSTRGPNLQ